MRNRDFAYTCAAILMMSAVFFAAMLYLPQLMINVLGFSPIGAGAGMLPMMATFAAVSFVAGNLYNRFGAEAAADPRSALHRDRPGTDRPASRQGDLRRAGPGHGGARARDRALLSDGHDRRASPPSIESRRSLAGAIIYMFQIAGGSVGLGLTTTVFIGASDRAQSGSGFIDGIQTAFTMDAAIAVGGFLIAAFLIQGRVHSPHLRRLLLAGPLTARPRTVGRSRDQFGPEPPPLPDAVVGAVVAATAMIVSRGGRADRRPLTRWCRAAGPAGARWGR